MVDRKKSFSPMALAFRRLRKNRLAMLGLFCLAAMIAFVCFGSYLVDTDVSENRLWAKEKGPGFTHPHCLEEVLFEKGKTPPLSSKFLQGTDIAYTILEEQKRELRVSLRRGKVSRIAEGASAMDSLDLGAMSSPFEILDDGTHRPLPPGILETGKKPPESVIPKNQRVMIIGWYDVGEPRKTSISLDDGVIRTISIDTTEGTKSVNSATVYGKNVQGVSLDGKTMTLWHPFGTDDLGRDLLLRIVSGGRISLMVGLIATLVSIVIGVSYGAIAGFMGGRADSIMMRIVDIIYGLPFIFLVLLLMVMFNRNIILLFIALGMVQWLTMSRIVRGQVLSLREMDFVDAARMSGASSPTIIFKHLIPHTAGPVLVYATLTVPVVILEESFLAFIGLPVQYQGTTMDSWGSLVHKGMNALGENGQNWWLLVFPSFAMVITLFALNCLGDGLRDSFDPKHK